MDRDLGRGEHARAGAAADARHAAGGRGGGLRFEAARALDLRPGRCGRLAAARVPEPALHRRAEHRRQRRVPLRDVDRHQRRRLLSELRGGRFLHRHQRLAGQERPCQGAARRGVSEVRLHHGGRHAFLSWPDEQRPRELAEPELGRLGRALRVPATEGRDPPHLDAGRRHVWPGHVTRRRDGRGRPDVPVGPGHDLALAHGVSARLRCANGLDGQAPRRGEPQPAGHGERP